LGSSGFDTMQFCRWIPMFWRKMLSFSELKSSDLKMEADSSKTFLFSTYNITQHHSPENSMKEKESYMKQCYKLRINSYVHLYKCKHAILFFSYVLIVNLLKYHLNEVITSLQQTKQQLPQWKGPSSPCPKNARQVCSM
jgi:hypothetical protein